MGNGDFTPLKKKRSALARPTLPRITFFTWDLLLIRWSRLMVTLKCGASTSDLTVTVMVYLVVGLWVFDL